MKNKRKTAIPRQYSLVRIIPSHKNFLAKKGDSKCPLMKEDAFVFLGEIPNMVGHCVVAGHKSGRIISGHHIENFEEIPENEV